MRPAVEARGLAPAQALSRQDRRGARPRRPRSTCSARVGYASPVAHLHRIRPQEPDPLCGVRRRRAASACRTATITCSRAPNTTPSASAYRNYIVEDADARRRSATPTRSADRIIALETAIAKVQWTPERQPRRQGNLQPDDPRAAARKLAPQIDWDRAACTKHRLGIVNTVIVRETERDRRASASWSPASRCDTWKDYLDLPLHQRPRAIPAQGIRRRALRFLRQDASPTCRCSATAGSAASTSSTARSARPSARSTSSATIRRRATRQMHELVGDILAALKEKIEQQQRGWTSRPARPRSRSSRASIRASAIR